MNIVPGSKYEHNNGNIYQVIMIANKETTRPDEYPVTVVYFDIKNGTTWAMPLSGWSGSFKTKVIK